MRIYKTAMRGSWAFALSLTLVACGDVAEDDQDPGGMAGDPVPQEVITPEPTPQVTPAVDPALTANLPAGVTAEMVAEGQQVFQGVGICATCHGQMGEGSALGPNLNDNEWLWVTGAGEAQLTEIETIVRTGVAMPKEYPAPMPPMGGAQINEEQIRQVSAYIYALGNQ